jgi:two-component system, OmpR family, phosphate regulon response regulator PhoB
MTSSEPRARQKVLVIDDEPDLRAVLTYNLGAAGFEVREAETGGGGLEAIAAWRPDLVILDLMLPDMPGTDVCRRIRADVSGRQPTILMLTAKSEEIDRIVGFELGADDYVVKPFSTRELVLRVGALLRRSASDAKGAGPEAGRRATRVGPLLVDPEGHHVFVEGVEISVSALEMKLLVYLLQHRGRVCARESILVDVWRYSPDATTRTLDTHVKRLRDKLGVAGDLIETVRGAGYRLSGAAPVAEETIKDG